ncbi:uncharacterized protein [Physcomitrium patens]|uniref:Uncharacterized protein n=1 Tax=Physcomitrium patens TaxID=3218 RepID=A9SRN5_PHYPA|nr:heat shock 70 kDa protein 12A-like [Physcomitrium patens]PNR44141.1 hypothetical protein PHYPA_016525 [Physcomitrium patens]|eukprot:XP_024390872.1 heat shock 70 kDa protein 12A-like [Physcomitrella patens]
MTEQVSSEAKVVVGLDFGTTFSGFAFAHKAKPTEIYTFYEWPRATKPYCKTLSGIYYEPGDGSTTQIKSWGFPALHEFTKDVHNLQRARQRTADLPPVGVFLVRFKLHLASKDSGESSAARLPPGYNVTKVISDYLREIGASILRHLRTKFNDELTLDQVQWCVTVPSIWDDHAKKQMEVCMMRAGLVRGSQSIIGSPHPLSIVLEPEAASCYCHRNMPDLELKAGDRLLVADIGGGTTDIVVQEWMSETPNDYRVKEVTYSTGGLCGGTYVDEQFNRLLFTRIQCLPQYLQKSSSFMSEIFKRWEEIKCSFGDHGTLGDSFEIQLPGKLAQEWEDYDSEHGLPPRDSYDELELTQSDMQSIFDPVVEQNLGLIADQLSRTSNVKVIFVVGGFAGSPYLMSKIKERFLGQVEKIISPVNPGSAVCQGAVMLALNPAGITSRIARKTYGFEVSRSFKPGDPEDSKYISWVGAEKKCDVNFSAYVRKGDPLDVDHCVSKDFSPLFPGARNMKLMLYSSNETDPKYTQGPGVDSKEEASFTIDITSSSHMQERPTVTVSMFFGRSAIDVKAVGKNFGTGQIQEFQLPVEFTGDWV